LSKIGFGAGFPFEGAAFNQDYYACQLLSGFQDCFACSVVFGSLSPRRALKKRRFALLFGRECHGHCSGVVMREQSVR